MLSDVTLAAFEAAVRANLTAWRQPVSDGVERLGETQDIDRLVVFGTLGDAQFQ